MLRRLGRPFAVAINREGLRDTGVNDYCAAEGIPVVLELPDSRGVAARYSRGELAIAVFPESAPSNSCTSWGPRTCSRNGFRGDGKLLRVSMLWEGDGVLLCATRDASIACGSILNSAAVRQLAEREE